MAHTIQRLTMYALIVALEQDLREFLRLYVSPVVGFPKLLPEQTAKRAQERREKDRGSASGAEDEVLDYLDLGDEIQAIRSHDSRLDEPTRNYIRRYYNAVTDLVATRNRVMHARPLEFDDYAKTTDLATTLSRTHGVLWANIKRTIREIERDASFAAGLSIPEFVDSTATLLHNLPQPEFDDTGFLGRDKELAELRRAIAGSYPVISIVGEGGLGKTALALKACYEVLDDEGAALDAIVWTTAKASKLTPTEIQFIEGAITSSLGLIEQAAEVLGRQNRGAPLDDLIMHLANNRVLLVIDNLETVIDENIRDFVRRVPKGSKVLFTSRIGLGAFDFPIYLSPLPEKEAAFYFRRVARVWSVNDFAAASQAVVEGFCQKLQFNPLFMKWFIQGVRGGQRPSAITNSPKLLLRFCLQNVFNTLPPDAQTILRVLACVNNFHSVASLSFFTDFDSFRIQAALSALLTANLLSTQRGRKSEEEDKYALGPLARLYMQHFLNPPIEEQRRYIAKQNILRSAKEEFSAAVGLDVFDINFIHVRDRDDYIVAKMLIHSLEHLRRQNVAAAREQLDLAAGLSPNYFEVKRVEALICVEEQNYFAAEAAYEAAISLAPARAPLRLWYGGFISRYLIEQDKAIEQLLEAERLAPDSIPVKLDVARVLQYLRRFEEAEDRLNAVKGVEGLPAKTRRVWFDLVLQNHTRKSDLLLSQNRPAEALAALEEAKLNFEEAPPGLIDRRTTSNVTRASRQLPSLRRGLLSQADLGRVEAIADWLADPQGKARSSNEALSDGATPGPGEETCQTEELPPNRGRLVQLHTNYAFVDTGAARLFFHRGTWVGPTDFRSLGEGTIVEFELGVSDRGPCALNVRPIMALSEAPGIGHQLFGHVETLSSTHGFLRCEDGRRIFFHRTSCLEGTKFRLLRAGERVRFSLTTKSGRLAGESVELHSGG